MSFSVPARAWTRSWLNISVVTWIWYQYRESRPRPYFCRADAGAVRNTASSELHAPWFNSHWFWIHPDPGHDKVVTEVEQMNEKSMHANIAASYKMNKVLHKCSGYLNKCYLELVREKKQKNYWCGRSDYFQSYLQIVRANRELKRSFSLVFVSFCQNPPKCFSKPQEFYLILYTITGAVKRSNKWLVFKALWGQWQ